MAFVAQRELKVIPKGTQNVIMYQPGDVIPDFGDWDTTVKRAHLNLEYVREVNGVEFAAKKPAPKKKPAKKAQALPHRSEEEMVETKPQETEAEYKVRMAALEASPYACAICLNKRFASGKGLQTHITLTHTKKG